MTNQPDQLAVSAEQVKVKYGSYVALRSVSFDVGVGEIVGILGANGAGKSTLVDAVVGARRISGGAIKTLGVDPVESASHVRPRLGVVLQSAGFPPGLKVNDIMKAWHRYSPGLQKERILETAKEVGITHLIGKRLAYLSGGELRRVDIGLALLSQPDLLVLDEPTTGLDPISRHNIWEVLAAARDNGMTIVLTSHYLEEIEFLCDRVFVLREGEIKASGSPRELARSVPSDRRCSFTLAKGADPSGLGLSYWGTCSPEAEGGYTWLSKDPSRDITELCARLASAGYVLGDVSVDEVSLDAAYSQLVGADGKVEG